MKSVTIKSVHNGYIVSYPDMVFGQTLDFDAHYVYQSLDEVISFIRQYYESNPETPTNIKADADK